MSSLLVIKGPAIGVKFELGEHTCIGRAVENEIQLEDPEVSRVHAEITRQRMAYTIRDLNSRNGVIVNGERVNERLLLRNDEVRIGSTVFLFNSDLQIRNARFSNSSVYLYPARDETLAAVARESRISNLTGPDYESVTLLLQLAELFSGAPATLAETAERLLGRLVPLLMADSAALLWRDRATDELTPVVVTPEGAAFRINRQVIGTVRQEKHALLTSEPMEDLPEHVRAAGTDESPSPLTTGISSICAPIQHEGDVLGVIAVEKEEMGFFSLRDLGVLQAVATIAAGTLQAAVALDEQTANREQPAEVFESREPTVRHLFDQATSAARTDTTVLVTGESGTGKEVLARHVHAHSARATGPFVAINCGAIPAELFESEFFGYEKGAFTGAAKTTAGKIEAAHGGTLFLDEIGELPLSQQPKLLRFLQERVFYRVGGTRGISANVRVIAASNKDLEAEVRGGGFREDLWYRLNVINLVMPPLRDRRLDIAPLAKHLLLRSAARLGRHIDGINDSAIEVLEAYSWPGNIRELENAIERAVLLARGRVLNSADFRHISDAGKRIAEHTRKTEDIIPLAEMERRQIIAALKRHDWNQARAADALGIHRNTLRNKIAEYGITAIGQ